MRVVKAESVSPILLWKQGEEGATRVEFDLTPYIKTFGEGVPQLTVKKPGDPKEYAAAVEREGDKAVWQVGPEWLTDDGQGRCQLSWHMNAGGVAKSDTYKTMVQGAMGMSDETAPEPQSGYLAQVQAAGVRAIGAAGQAEESAKKAAQAGGYAVHQPIIGENGNWWLWDGEEYVDSGRSSQGADAGLSVVDGLLCITYNE